MQAGETPRPGEAEAGQPPGQQPVHLHHEQVGEGVGQRQVELRHAARRRGQRGQPQRAALGLVLHNVNFSKQVGLIGSPPIFRCKSVLARA